MNPVVDPRVLSQLSAHDFRVEECRQSIAALEKRNGTLDELEREYATTAAQAKAHLDELKLQIRQAELEVADLRRQSKVHQGHLNDISDSREYRALNEEVRYLQRQIGEIEERTLNVMEESEKAEKEVESSREEFNSHHEEFERERAQIERDLADQHEKLKQRLAQRNEFYRQIPPQTRRFYERRGKRQTMPVVWMGEGASCGYCHHRLTPQARLEVIGAKSLVTCESCGRVIVAAPTSDSSASSHEEISKH
jgi:predicted  nucleic acid-binding Zn-ribbon protein